MIVNGPFVSSDGSADIKVKISPETQERVACRINCVGARTTEVKSILIAIRHTSRVDSKHLLRICSRTYICKHIGDCAIKIQRSCFTGVFDYNIEFECITHQLTGARWYINRDRGHYRYFISANICQVCSLNLKIV